YHHLVDHGVPLNKQRRDLLKAIPSRSNMASLAIFKLPRLGPNRLDARMEAFRRAHEATLFALDQPLHEGLLVLGDDQFCLAEEMRRFKE
ncbi:MAG: hypothetical protein P1V97_21975, partial [Planctomycetota bacterium]|nr:hypothetical protein [Planctomycetota bacterium]